MNYIKKYKEWITSKYIDSKTKKELLNIKDNNEIKDRFYKDLEFGTAGLRGIIGAGTNRINIYIIRKVTQGLANYILSKNKKKNKVVIAFDSRKMSDKFANEAALVLAANNIYVYKFKNLHSTPQLSFAVRYLKCISGINITASHNPKEYNGYKVYWEDGAQISSPVDKEISESIKKIKHISDIKIITKEEAKTSKYYNILDKKIDLEYFNAIKKQLRNVNLNNIKIVYTPLNGTGNIPVKSILTDLNFKKLYIVKEQMLPDSNFTTVKYPNPESKEAFKLSLELAKKVDADIICATDPDADRLGVYVKHRNLYKQLTGNQMAAILCNYELEYKNKYNKLKKDSYIVKTIVTSNLLNKIAENYSVNVKEVLTGFKYIGKEITKSEKNNKGTFEFGAEESYGCLVGTYARDKDGILATMKFCEMCSYYKSINSNIYEELNKIYKKYGYFQEETFSVEMKGINGLSKINKIMDVFRTKNIKNFVQLNVLEIRDYKFSKRKNIINKKEIEIKLPKSNVLYFKLDNDSFFCIRPSGTEPKIKFYISIKSKFKKDAVKLKNFLKKEIKNYIKNV